MLDIQCVKRFLKEYKPFSTGVLNIGMVVELVAIGWEGLIKGCCVVTVVGEVESKPEGWSRNRKGRQAPQSCR